MPKCKLQSQNLLFFENNLSDGDGVLIVVPSGAGGGSAFCAAKLKNKFFMIYLAQQFFLIMVAVNAVINQPQRRPQSRRQRRLNKPKGPTRHGQDLFGEVENEK